jgi:hypothetical protein
VVQEFTAQSHRKDLSTPPATSTAANRFHLNQFPTFQSFNFDADADTPAAAGEGTAEGQGEGEDISPEENIIPYSPRNDVEVSYIVSENERIAKIVKEQVRPYPSLFVYRGSHCCAVLMIV